jgi:hypothetical protein
LFDRNLLKSEKKKFKLENFIQWKSDATMTTAFDGRINSLNVFDCTEKVLLIKLKLDVKHVAENNLNRVLNT